MLLSCFNSPLLLFILVRPSRALPSVFLTVEVVVVVNVPLIASSMDRCPALDCGNQHSFPPHWDSQFRPASGWRAVEAAGGTRAEKSCQDKFQGVRTCARSLARGQRQSCRIFRSMHDVRSPVCSNKFGGGGRHAVNLCIYTCALIKERT